MRKTLPSARPSSITPDWTSVNSASPESFVALVSSQLSGRVPGSAEWDHLTICGRSVPFLSRLRAIRKFKNGRITEQGTHDDLMTLDGEYAALYREQETVEALEDPNITS